MAGCSGQHRANAAPKSLPTAGRRGADGVGDGVGGVKHPVRTPLWLLDCLADELDDFIACGDKGKVQVAALHLGPIVAGVDAQAGRILREGLVQDADDD